MSVKMHIMPELGLSYLHYAGFITPAEMSQSIAACVRHPAFKPHFRHIADLTHVTGFESDYLGIMRVQAQAIGMLRGTLSPSYCIFLSPTQVAQSLAGIVKRSWEGTDDPVLLILTDEEQVESHLGLRGMSVAQMRAAALPLAAAGAAPRPD